MTASRKARDQGKLRALVLSCSYGDGHRSAAEAIKSYLKDEFIVRTVDTTTDPRLQVGVLASLGIDSAAIYNNVILKGHWYKLQNMYDELRSLTLGQVVQRCPAPHCNTAQKNSLRSIFLTFRPDVIVTVYHLDLLPILEVAKDLGNLPVLHISTDMDAKMAEVFGKEGPASVYPKLLVGLPFNNDMSKETLKPLDSKFTFLSGYPVRDAFLRTLASEANGQTQGWSVPDDTTLVLVMSGGGGQRLPWPEKLAEEGIGRPLHVVVVVGRNADEGDRLLEALPSQASWGSDRDVRQGTDPSVTVEVAIDPTNQNETMPFYIGAAMLAELMDSADAIITKPGGGTSAEIAYRGLPALFDASEGLLHWEEFTVQVFESVGSGLRFTGMSSLRSSLQEVLGYSRSTRLAEDPQSEEGTLLNTAEKIRGAIRSLVNRECIRCPLFPDEMVDLS